MKTPTALLLTTGLATSVSQAQTAEPGTGNTSTLSAMLKLT